ncbi:hypothetical protein SAMN06295879_2256 [Agreia bicolorata]|uniref:Lipoprotein n=1 Tax=Agreia bicolorata TaxID=110935 RepID=A0A1T4Y3W5_9MICO|nr:hypothetical protein [Agreia bicolorata]KJC64553.1 hypothetical protein TZ00_09285 [Agreia bicolorata]SKA96502.1 hypothetical protein SAMN06295879_2256 [Agreia bicolorata]
MRVTRMLVGLSLLCCAVALAGCASENRVAENEPTPTATASAADSLGQACELASAVLSDANNADSGYRRGELDAAGWAQLVADAKAKMITLAAGASPGAEAQIADLASDVASIPDAAGAPDAYVAVGATADAAAELNKVCGANGTEIVVSAKYGG